MNADPKIDSGNSHAPVPFYVTTQGSGVFIDTARYATQEEVLKLSAEFRQRHIPCDVIGLEPKWQTHSYSCSYVWSDTFPNPGPRERR